MDARNFFVPHGTEEQPVKRNQDGFSLGGPLIQTEPFLLGEMECINIRESIASVNTIPTLLERVGDHSGESAVIPTR